MENQTFRSRLVVLVQKSRKAVRLYSSMEKNSTDSASDYRQVQAEEWKVITTDLLRELTTYLENPNGRRLAAEIYGLRDRFYSDWRLAESDLHVAQRDLITSAEHGDFTRSATLSNRLIRLKARFQACQAAYHELQDVLTKSKITEPDLGMQSDLAFVHDLQSPLFNMQSDSSQEPSGGTAKVIPLRKRQVLSA